MVKSIASNKNIENSSEEIEVNVEELPKDFRFPVPPKTLKNQEKEAEPGENKENPIFIRVDKFQESKKEFIDIQRNVKDIEKALRKLKDIKSKEDVEISAWTADIEKIKSKLSEIDSNIFNKL